MATFDELRLEYTRIIVFVLQNFSRTVGSPQYTPRHNTLIPETPPTSDPQRFSANIPHTTFKNIKLQKIIY
jgi:hypothetical protein